MAPILKHGFRITPERFIGVFALLVVPILLWSAKANDRLIALYNDEMSAVIRDRNGVVLEILPNTSGEYMTEGTSTPRVRGLVIQKEDRFFYYHPGINPFSMLRSLIHSLWYHEHVGGSTITQQLTKNLLHHENARTMKNRWSEIWYAMALELYTPKERILTMYLSTAYFGKQIEGIEGASRYYFGKGAGELEDGEILRLLALLSSPAYLPESMGNTVRATNLGKRIGINEIPPYTPPPVEMREQKKDTAMFELSSLYAQKDCIHTCTTTVDKKLTATIRDIVHDRLSTAQFASVENAAVVVIKLGTNGGNNSVLAIVGSPNPRSASNGAQINMALEPRPIGSTWKPYIYGKAIEQGARPYSLIDDSEYRYEIGTGYAFYPKNYDGIYRGDVTMHYALSNSLNVPAVRALQFDSIPEFGAFMNERLGFTPLQSFDTYQLSIALGGLEMNPLLLAHYFSVFPENGLLHPLELIPGIPLELPMSKKLEVTQRIFQGTTTELINAMLKDRLMGVEQFGLESNLNLPFSEYAVKTGTTYDYHDSWTIGYTPDVVVVVWIGNSDNKPMDLLTGARGAGKIWHDVMALLLGEKYISPTNFANRSLVDVTTNEGQSFGLPLDDIDHARNIFKGMNGADLLLEPHDNDTLMFEPNMSIPLRARKSLTFAVDGVILGTGTKIFWTPNKPGVYSIEAIDNKESTTRTLHVRILAPE